MMKSFLSKIKNNFFRRNRFREVGFAEKKSGPKVHIGCGPIDIPGWINIDARAFPHIHIVADSLDLKEFSDGSIQEIYMCHVLEHCSFHDVDNLIQIYHSKLRTDGTLRLSVPDFELLIRIYLELDRDLEFIKKSLMGGQEYPQNYHRSVFDKRLLSTLLRKAGFRQITEWETEKDFGQDLGDWSCGRIRKGFRSFEVSLNLKAIK